MSTRVLLNHTTGPKVSPSSSHSSTIPSESKRMGMVTSPGNVILERYPP